MNPEPPPAQEAGANSVEPTASAAAADAQCAALLRCDRRMRLAWWVAVAPLLILTGELPFQWAAFTAAGCVLYFTMWLALPLVALRELLFKLFSPLFYICYIGYQVDFFFDSARGWSDPAQGRLALALLPAAVGLIADGVYWWLAHRAARLPRPAGITARVGLPFGGAALRRQIELLRQTDEARANQAWIKQAGRQE